MVMTRTTFTIDEETVELARKLEINVSAAARLGVLEAVRAALAAADRAAYERAPEVDDGDWTDAEAWSAE